MNLNLKQSLDLLIYDFVMKIAHFFNASQFNLSLSAFLMSFNVDETVRS